MSRQEIMNKINQIAQAEMHDKAAYHELKNEQDRLSDTGIDSFDFIMLYMKLGEQFGIDNKYFKEGLSDSNPTMNVLIDFIEAHLNKAA